MLCITQNGGSLGRRTGFAAFSPPVKADCGGYSYRFVLQIQLIYMPLPMKSSSKEDAEFVDYGELDIHIFEEMVSKGTYIMTSIRI
jgi:hypothetical protein